MGDPGTIAEAPGRGGSPRVLDAPTHQGDARAPGPAGLWPLPLPPKAEEAPNPMSSTRTISTLGAPAGVRGSVIGGKELSGCWAP